MCFFFLSFFLPYKCADGLGALECGCFRSFFGFSIRDDLWDMRLSFFQALLVAVIL
jgi:hypothetical protein